MIDTHSHIDMEEYKENFDAFLDEIKANEVEKVIIPGVEPSTFSRIIEYCEKYDMLYGAVGIHPEELAKCDENSLEIVKEFIKHKKIVAIGEIGLDYHYCEDTKEEQKILLRKQLEIAETAGMPVLIHDREAHEDTLEILNDYNLKTVVMHCFSGTPEFAEKCLQNDNFYIAVGGVVTFKNAKDLKETVKIVPQDRLLLETDAPYLAPVPFRGKLNTPAYLKYIAQTVADIKQTDVNVIKESTTANAKRIFNFNND